MINKKWMIALSVLAVCAVGAVVIITGEAKRAEKERAVSVRLLWLNQAQFAGIYAAREEGFYRDVGLNVDILAGGPGVNPVLLVASGSETFGVASATDIVLARSKGVPVRALSTIVAENPTSFFARADSGIATVKDFVGRKVGTKLGFELDYYLDAMLEREGVPRSALDIVPIQFDLSPFFRGDVEVWCGYRINEPNIVRARGIEVNEILPSDYGIDVGGDVLFTSEEFYRENTELAWAFVDATWRGWEFARDNKDATLKHVIGYSPQADRQHEAAMLDSVIRLVFAGRQTIPPPESAESWERAAKFLLAQGVLDEPVDGSTCFWRR